MNEPATEPSATRIHLVLDRRLREQLRVRARAEDRTMRAVIERALWRELQDPGEADR
jgi:hypothetical protein